MDGSLSQYLAGPKELIVKVMIMEALPNWFADNLAAAIMLNKLGIFDILQRGFVFYRDDLLKVCVDYFFLRLNLAQLFRKFGLDATSSNVEYIKVVFLEAILKIFNKDLAFLRIALELR